MRIAVAHHWFVTRGGGERVAECIAALFPKAEIFTLVASQAGLPESLASLTIHTSFLQKIPFARTHHRHFLPLYPRATESLDVRNFDLILTSDSGPVKGVRLDAGAIQICYCHSPMRYLWDGFEQYRAGMEGITRAAFTAFAPQVRRWDAVAAQRVNYFVANSHYVSERIQRCYGREAEVIHPPIDLARAARVRDVAAADSYLCAGRLVAYKRTEVLIEACKQLRRSLRVAGTGPELRRLREIANGDPLIEFLGELSSTELWLEFARCRALLFAADEDFGMVPLEAKACGRPVIAFGAGGSLETIRASGSRVTGTYFAEQNAASAAQAIVRWENELEREFRPENARDWAGSFSTETFLEQYRSFVLKHVPQAAEQMATVNEAAAIVSPRD